VLHLKFGVEVVVAHQATVIAIAVQEQVVEGGEVTVLLQYLSYPVLHM